MSTVRPVAVTIGDAAGIGPELSLKSAVDADLTAQAPVLLVGSAALLRRVAATLELSVEIVEVTDPGEVRATPGVAYVFDVPGLDAASVVPGELSAGCGDAAVQWIHAATRLATEGRVLAVASAPTNKAAFNAAGHHFEGQTEIFADLTGTTRFHTILVGGPLRVSLVSAHCSMTEAVSRVKADRVEWILRQLREALVTQFGLPVPRIAVAGLNPHAGENGVLGTEEIDHVIPVTNRLRDEGMDVSDPLAADSLFDAAERGRYDAVLAMYHDQGTIPLKKYGYVTYAAGLPIVRTTAGHGTAFDIAWTGKADPALMGRAISLAVDLGRPRAGGPGVAEVSA
jgi:4-hydroxythreonine-4-phosphate dehydrogenase